MILSPQQTGAGRIGGPLYSGLALTQYFEQALLAKLKSIVPLMSIIGSGGMFKMGLPQTWDLGAKGPALTYSVPTKPKGQVLGGSDTTANARVQIDMWAYSEAPVKQGLAAIFNAINGPGQVWGNGTCEIMAVVHQDDVDADEPPKSGTDQWLYHSLSEYTVKYRISAAGGG